MVVSLSAALILAILSAYLVVSERRLRTIGLPAALLLLAFLEVADTYTLSMASDTAASRRIAMFLESLIPCVFLVLSITHSRRGGLKALSPFWWVLAVSTVAFPAAVMSLPGWTFFFSPDLQAEKMVFLEQKGYWFYMGIMSFCVLALMNLEVTFSASSGTERWRMKFEIVGLGAALAVLIFYFSQGLLYRAINLNLVPIRSGVLIISALLIAYSNVFRGSGIRVAVSRYIVYRSMTLLVVGLYLIMLGLAGEGMKHLDISLGRSLSIFIAFAFGIAVIVFFISETMRRRVKVFISKHFYAHKYDYRTEWLKFTQRLSWCRSVEAMTHEILTMYKDTFGVKAAAMYLSGSGGEVYMLKEESSMKSAPTEFPVSPGLRSYFLERERVYRPGDGEYTPEAGDSSLAADSGIRLAVPLICNNALEGVVALGDQLVEGEYSFEDFDLMKILGRQAALAVSNLRLSDELVETREMAALARVSSFVVHDIKNLTYSISLLLDNAGEHINNPEFQSDMLDTLNNAVTKMKHLTQKLKTLPEKRFLDTTVTELSLLAREVVADAARLKSGVELDFSGIPVFSAVDREEMKKVLLNLLLNAFDAVGEQGRVTVSTGMEGDSVFLSVTDNGCGIERDFMANHMFRPFRTTKQKGMGIGLYQCRQIVESHHGSISVASEPGRTTFKITLPASEPVAELDAAGAAREGS